MEENITATLTRLEDILRSLGKFRERNAVILLSRLLRAHGGAETMNDLELLVETVEERQRNK